jgi:hypothetical protein
VDRQTRKNIKTDKFAEEVTHTFEFLSEHGAQTRRYGLIGLAVLVVGLGIYFFHSHQVSARETALAQAMKDDPAMAPTQTPPVLTEDQIKGRVKLYEPIVSNYHGTLEGAIAEMTLASIQAEKGTPEGTAAAEKMYQDVIDSAPTDYASVARLALAESYAGEGKTDQAKKLLQNIIDHPTTLVSKEQATLAMASVIEQSNPAEAKKLLDPLVRSRAPISRAAVNEIGKIPQ